MKNSLFKANNFFLKIVLLSLSIVLFLCFLELALQITSTYKADNFANTQDWQQKFVTRNSHGYRDKEYSYKKPAGIYRILVLGDSQTFGHGIKKLEDTWHKKLEVLLNKGLPKPRFEVISLAGEGWNTDTQLYELFENGFNYNPDLVLLAFYHNDIPNPKYFECDAEYLELLPNDSFSNKIKKNSKIYIFLKLRINKLLEKIGKKPSFIDCSQKVFQSRGWEMEKIYLNSIVTATSIKNIHLLIANIPLLYKLGNNYPLTDTYSKLENYFKSLDVDFIDLFQQGFKGLDANKLIVSKIDRHLNEYGAEVVANTLYKNLSLLKTYDNLSKIRGAFELKNLINENVLSRKVDKKFNQLNHSGDTIKCFEKNKSLTVLFHNGNYIYKSLLKGEDDTFTTTSLSSNGYFLSWEKRVQSQSKIKKSIERLTREKASYRLETLIFNRDKNRPNIPPIRTTRNFILKTPIKNLNSVELEENIFFSDPKVVEEKLFEDKYAPSKWLGENEKKSLISRIDPKNENAFEAINSPEISDLINEHILFEEFMVILRYGGKNYLDQLTKVISIKKPSIISLKATARYYSYVKSLNKLDRLIKDNPKIFSYSLNKK